ncbi:MAG TPA: histidine kinase dimerization/phospho-acceptor domain-containing protein, partial [Chloroflexota bacterium]
MGATSDDGERGVYTRADLRLLRLEGLDWLLPTIYAGAVGLTFLPLGPAGDGVWLGIGLALLAALCYAVGRRSRQLAGALLLLGLALGWAAALALYPGEVVAGLGPLLVGATGALFGARAALLAAALASGLLWSSPAELGAGARLAGAATAWLAAYLSWLTARPAAQPLEWAWSSYVDALRARDELRRHQGELSAALKSLDLAYRRLEHLNDELARARRVADEARRLKSEFAASISHELRTPLNLIVGFSELMVASPRAYGLGGLPPALRADVDAIYRNARHLGGLIDDVLDLSQIEAGRMGLSRAPVGLAEVVDEAARAVAARIAALGLALDLAVQPDLPPVSIDRVRIRQILINLLNNAARFTDRGGIAIGAERRGNEVVVCVRDSGVGIPPDELGQVFDEFHQAQGTIERRVGGSGL